MGFLDWQLLPARAEAVIEERIGRLDAVSQGVLAVASVEGETFTAEEDELEAFMYGFSVLHCLPAGMAEQPSAQTGTVMRPKTLRRCAEDAGFCDVEILPIDNFFFRFYRLKAVCPAEQQN